MSFHKPISVREIDFAEFPITLKKIEQGFRYSPSLKPNFAPSRVINRIHRPIIRIYVLLNTRIYTRLTSLQVSRERSWLEKRISVSNVKQSKHANSIIPKLASLYYTKSSLKHPQKPFWTPRDRFRVSFNAIELPDCFPSSYDVGRCTRDPGKSVAPLASPLISTEPIHQSKPLDRLN